MNELKSHDLVDIQDYRGEVYLKSDADKVIAELKAERDHFCRWLKSERALNIQKERHHKHKRCLAQAQRCMDAHIETEADAAFFTRWEHRWLTLAEKFKEVK